MKRGLYAEKHAESLVRRLCGCVVTWRAPCVRFQNADCMASDIVGKRADGSTVWVQVTTGGPGAVGVRKRKMAAIPWGKHDTVLLFSYPVGVGRTFAPTAYGLREVGNVAGVAKKWVDVTDWLNNGDLKNA